MKTQIVSSPTDPKQTHFPTDQNPMITETQVKKQAKDDQAGSENAVSGRVLTSATNEGAGGGEVMSGRERLKRHRVDVAGRVWIPDMWGQEGLLKDWSDCTVFDASLRKSSIMSARAALVEEARRMRANSSGLGIENRC